VSPKFEIITTRFNLTVTTVRNLQAVAALLVFIGGFLLWAATRLRPPIWIWTTGALTVGFMLGFPLAVLLIRLNLNKQVVDSGFVVTNYEIRYIINEMDYRRHTCIRRFTLKAVRYNACMYYFDDQWTGRGVSHVNVTSAGHSLLGDVPDRSTRRWIIIYLGRTYSCGDEVVLEITQELHDDQGQFGHFIGKILKEKMQMLTLMVEMPKNLGFDPVVSGSLEKQNRQTWWVRTQDLNSKVVRVGNTWSLTVSNPSPIGANVMLKWSWEGGY
jgi:hypothetical protein